MIDMRERGCRHHDGLGPRAASVWVPMYRAVYAMGGWERAMVRRVWLTVKIVSLCVVLAGLGVGVLYALLGWAAPEEPLVDLTQRSGAGTPDPGQAKSDESLRFAVATMVSAEATFSTYRRLVQRICRDVGRKDAFVLRPSYAEVRRELEQGKVDVAFVCTGTYVCALPGKRVKLLVQPEFEAGLAYRSLLIVPARSRAASLDDLRGSVMAFTDPESNTGCLVPSAMLADRGDTPSSFFGKIVFTGSHDRSIRAVALGAVDAASVDSLVWESNVREDPSLAGRVKIIWQSEAFGPPPIVVPEGLDEGLERSLRQAFLAMDQDEEGRGILTAIGIRRWVPARPEDYRTAAELCERLRAREGR